MQDTHDPFSYLLNEIRAYDAGLRRDWDAGQRDHYLDLLLVEEAQEIAWGRRHLTVVHGEQVDEVEAELLDELFAAWEDIATRAPWARIGGMADGHLTLSLAGEGVAHLLMAALDAAVRVNPGDWRVVEVAFV